MAGLPNIRHMVKTLHKREYSAISPLNAVNSAAGKNVFITGGGTGIGYAIARGFAIAGASTVILSGRRSDVLQASMRKLSEEVPSAQILAYPLDISDEEAVKSAFDTARSHIDPAKDIDILVLSAVKGVAGLRSLSYSPQQIYESINTNLVGNINAVRAFLALVDPSNPASTTDKVILEVSTNATHALYPLMPLYGASKLASTSFMRHILAEYKETGLRIHSFNPGSVLTDPAKEAGMDESSLAWDDVSLPGGFAVWLASKQAEFLNGRFVMSSWDVDELVAMKEDFRRDEDLGKIVLKVTPDS